MVMPTSCKPQGIMSITYATILPLKYPPGGREGEGRGGSYVQCYLSAGDAGGSKDVKLSRFSGTYSWTSITLLMLPRSSYMCVWSGAYRHSPSTVNLYCTVDARFLSELLACLFLPLSWRFELEPYRSFSKGGLPVSHVERNMCPLRRRPSRERTGTNTQGQR